MSLKLNCEWGSVYFIVERYVSHVSNVFYSERKIRVFYSQSDKILAGRYIIYPK